MALRMSILANISMIKIVCFRFVANYTFTCITVLNASFLSMMDFHFLRHFHIRTLHLLIWTLHLHIRILYLLIWILYLLIRTLHLHIGILHLHIRRFMIIRRSHLFMDELWPNSTPTSLNYEHDPSQLRLHSIMKMLL